MSSHLTRGNEAKWEGNGKGVSYIWPPLSRLILLCFLGGDRVHQAVDGGLGYTVAILWVLATIGVLIIERYAMQLACSTRKWDKT